ncbi:MAG: hypothetical protein Q9174_002708 [Haloplaca sp. 1 TL-2023]
MEIVPEEVELPFEPTLQESDESLQSRPDETRYRSPSNIRRTPTTQATTADAIEAPARRRIADPEVIEKIETVVLNILQSLQRQDDEISITLKTRQQSQNQSSSQSSRFLRATYKLSYPGATPEEAWRFSRTELVEKVCQRTSSMLTCSPAVVHRILELIHEALIDNVVVSKRRPILINRLRRNIYYKDPELFKSQKVVDRYVDILSYTFGVQRAALNVIATAKGLVADGIAIMYTYKHGSRTLSHENANLKTPTVRWLGVRSNDLFPEGSSAEPMEDRTGLLKLSRRDRKKALDILCREVCEEDGVEKEWRRELQIMLMLNVKVEMEILAQREGGVENWVDQRLCKAISGSNISAS